jgi:hypothetical protein
LLAIRGATIVFAPGSFLGITEQVRASKVMVVANLGTAHAAEKFFRPIRACAVQAVGFFVVDALISKRPCSSFQLPDSSALTTVPLAMRF